MRNTLYNKNHNTNLPTGVNDPADFSVIEVTGFEVNYKRDLLIIDVREGGQEGTIEEDLISEDPITNKYINAIVDNDTTLINWM